MSLSGKDGLKDRESSRAKQYFNRSLDLSRSSGRPNPKLISLNRQGLAMCYYLEKDYPKALKMLENDLNNDVEIAWQRHANLARVYEAMGKDREALEHLKKAIEILEKIWRHLGLHEYKMVAMTNREAVYHQAVALLFDLGEYREAFDYAELARGRAFVDMLGNRELKPKDTTTLVQNKKIGELRNRLKQMKGERALFKKDRDMRDLNLVSDKDIVETEKALEEEIRKLKKVNFEFMSTTMVEPLKIDEVSSLLPESVSLISYFVTDECIYAWVLDKGKMSSIKIPVSKEKLERLIRLFRMSVLEMGINRDLILEQRAPVIRDPKEYAEQLYLLLFDPLKDHIKNKQICIVPHDVLHYLPFSALYDGSKYILEDYAISYGPSATVLKYCFDKRRPDKDQFFGMGNPKLEKAALDLPFAQREVEQISVMFPHSKALYREEATEEQFKAAGEKETLIHLACHGEYKADAPLLSNLRLSPSVREDGKLEVHEIFDLDLKPSLTVLSACQTGLGKRTSGDEITGLARAFIYAGTPSIITSLWSVNDKSTAELMTSFYRNLKSRSKAESLQAAKLDIMNKYPQPFYWAPFCLTGDFR